MEILTTGTVEIAATDFRHSALVGAQHYTSVIKPIGTVNAFDLATENTRTLNQSPPKGELICIYLPGGELICIYLPAP